MVSKPFYLGLMSGTSLDGIDVVLADLASSTPQLIAAQHFEFPDTLRETLLTMTTSTQANFVDLGEAHTWLGECYADAVLQLLDQAQIKAQEVSAIGNHGQTVFHHPCQPHPFTMQIGNHSVLAAKTGIPVVADFRSLDIAYGGQGAPLAPLFHQAFFARPSKNIAVLNIGGTANVSILKGKELIAAFDTGPGNTLIDAYMQTYFDQAYDQNGKLAKSGQVDQNLLQLLLEDEYFSKPPPKSTGKEYFNLNWLGQSRDATLPTYGNTHAEHTLSHIDILSTLTELTAVSISQALQAFAIDEILICGGGVYNDFLLERIKYHNPKTPIENTMSQGLNPQWVEAAAFAWLAKMRLEEKRFDLVTLSGSNQPVLLGQLIYP